MPLFLSFSQLVTTSLFFLSVSLFLFCYSYLFYFLDSIYKWYHTAFVFLWHILLTIMPSKSIHVVVNDKISFFFGWVVFLCIYILHILYPFICWWMLRLLQYLGNCKQCYYSSGVHVYFQISVFFSFLFFRYIYPWVELLGYVVVQFLLFWGISILFPTVTAPIHFPTNSV